MLASFFQNTFPWFILSQNILISKVAFLSNISHVCWVSQVCLEKRPYKFSSSSRTQSSQYMTEPRTATLKMVYFFFNKILVFFFFCLAYSISQLKTKTKATKEKSLSTGLGCSQHLSTSSGSPRFRFREPLASWKQSVSACTLALLPEAGVKGQTKQLCQLQYKKQWPLPRGLSCSQVMFNYFGLLGALGV